MRRPEGPTSHISDLPVKDDASSVREYAGRLCQLLRAEGSSWQETATAIEEIVERFEGGLAPNSPLPSQKPTLAQRKVFGKLLRAKRNAAGFSRVQLARLAKLSDATIKFIETAHNPPSVATLIRLIRVAALDLSWADVPWQDPQVVDATPVKETALAFGPVRNWLVVPGFDPLEQYQDLRRFLKGFAGHLEQSTAYLDYESAFAYLNVQQASLLGMGLISTELLAAAARHIGAVLAGDAFAVVALGAGAAMQEISLVQQLLLLGLRPHELCMLDISQALLARAFRHATERLACPEGVPFWAILGNFNELQLYDSLCQSVLKRRHVRLFSLLGGTFSHMDHEPRFVKHSLASCAQSGDLLLLDIQVSRAPSTETHQIRIQDKALAAGVPPLVAAWLGGPICRHNPQDEAVDITWDLDTRCPVPGSYALDAVANVQSAGDRPIRRFSMFRFRRYDVRRLTEQLLGLDWQEVACLPFGPKDEPAALMLYRKL